MTRVVPIETKEDLELPYPAYRILHDGDIDLEGMEWTPFETFSGILTEGHCF